MVVTVFREPVLRRYQAPWCSLSFCFNVLTIVGAVLIPLYVGLASNNFWLKRNTLVEQPNIDFKYDIIFVAQGREVGSPGFKTWAWASDAQAREVYQPNLRAPILRAWREDTNLDDKADTWHVTVQMPMSAGEQVLQVQSLLFFDYQLTGPAKLDMGGLVHLEHSGAIPASSLMVTGEARFQQHHALSVRRNNALPENQQGFPTGIPVSMRSMDIGSIVSSYAARNYTMQLANSYKVWNTQGASDSFSASADMFSLNMTMRIPTDEFIYTPGLPEVLKYAWIQYFALFAVFYISIEVLKAFVYSNQVLETQVANEGRTKFSRVVKAHNF